MTLIDFSGDVIGSLLDLEAKEIVFSVNGKALKPFDQVSKLKSIKLSSSFLPSLATHFPPARSSSLSFPHQLAFMTVAW